MRTQFARVSNYAAIVALLAVTGLVVGIAQEKFSLRAKMTGKSSANLPVFLEVNGQQTQVATTGADGDFELAMDPAKNGKQFAIYRDNCNRLVIRPRDPQQERDCRKQAEQEKDKSCKTCEPVAWFEWGRSATMALSSGGIGPLGWSAISGAALLGTVVGVKTAGNGTPSSSQGGPNVPAFVSRNGQASVTFTLQPGGCANFQQAFTANLTVSGHTSADAIVTVSLIESITRTYMGRIANNVFDGTAAGQFASGRRFMGTLRVVFNDQGLVVGVTETLNVEASPTAPACVATYSR